MFSACFSRGPPGFLICEATLPADLGALRTQCTTHPSLMFKPQCLVRELACGPEPPASGRGSRRACPYLLLRPLSQRGSRDLPPTWPECDAPHGVETHCPPQAEGGLGCQEQGGAARAPDSNVQSCSLRALPELTIALTCGFSSRHWPWSIWGTNVWPNRAMGVLEP